MWIPLAFASTCNFTVNANVSFVISPHPCHLYGSPDYSLGAKVVFIYKGKISDTAVYSRKNPKTILANSSIIVLVWPVRIKVSGGYGTFPLPNK